MADSAASQKPQQTCQALECSRVKQGATCKAQRGHHDSLKACQGAHTSSDSCGLQFTCESAWPLVSTPSLTTGKSSRTCRHTGVVQQCWSDRWSLQAQPLAYSRHRPVGSPANSCAAKQSMGHLCADALHLQGAWRGAARQVYCMCPPIACMQPARHHLADIMARLARPCALGAWCDLDPPGRRFIATTMCPP